MTKDSDAPTLEPQNTHTRNHASPAIGPGSHAANGEARHVDTWVDAEHCQWVRRGDDTARRPISTPLSDVVDLADRAVGTAIRQLTSSGGREVQQVLAYDVAHAASAVATAKALLDYGAKGDVEARITRRSSPTSCTTSSAS